jgi:hypothetical protein
LTRPKLGFKLGAGEQKRQIGKTRAVGEGREFPGKLGNIGRSALRDNLRDFNRFRSFFPVETRLNLRANDAGFCIFSFRYVR